MGILKSVSALAKFVTQQNPESQFMTFDSTQSAYFIVTKSGMTL
ncbi:Uncharacterized protein dnm_091850 [Desulfonema magnum]|uniref:Uncharacterized protein n=1 Tax=Desulfonema magnum TaxID=45655 RepID=A0A975GUK5_9BACT|nr:Uncharacterized protein dnm_091850 [Desulfonema magnum]